jgi:hypothetical protein
LDGLTAESSEVKQDQRTKESEDASVVLSSLQQNQFLIEQSLKASLDEVLAAMNDFSSFGPHGSMLWAGESSHSVHSTDGGKGRKNRIAQ